VVLDQALLQVEKEAVAEKRRQGAKIVDWNQCAYVTTMPGHFQGSVQNNAVRYIGPM
jgi:hypothetical protein